MGGKFLWDDDKETPEVLSSTYLFPEQKKMIEFEVRPWLTNSEAGPGSGVGNIFYGSDGYLVIKGYNTYESFKGRKGEPGPKNKDSDPVGKHFANFIDAVRKRDPKSSTDRSRPRTTARAWPTWATSPTASAASSSSTRPPKSSSAIPRPTPC